MSAAEAIRLVLLDVDGVLSDGRLYLGSIEELKAYDARDGFGVTLLQAAGLRVGILTGRRSGSVEKRAHELGIDPLVQGRPDKAQAFEEILGKLKLAPEQVCYMGDDWLDLPLLGRVGLAAAPADARPEVREACAFVAQAPGGRGAVRELAEHILREQGRLEELLERYREGRGEAASARKNQQ